MEATSEHRQQNSSETPKNSTEVVEEWEIVPTKSHPESGITSPYPCAPGRSGGLTKQRARELATGRNRAGEPSPAVHWTAQPTGNDCLKSNLQTSEKSR